MKLIAEKLFDRYGRSQVDTSTQAEPAPFPVWAGVKGVKHYLDTKIDGHNVVLVCTSDVVVHTKTRGSHMSRHIESLLEFPATVDRIENIAETILKIVCEKLKVASHRDGGSAYVTTKFDYFFGRTEAATVTEHARLEPLSMKGDGIENQITIEVPCMNACPCALKESGGEVTHTQRVMVKVESFKPIDINEVLTRIFEVITPVKSHLKRADEVELIRDAYMRRLFVEDVVRTLDQVLPDCHIFAESLESIHPHNAYAANCG